MHAIYPEQDALQSCHFEAVINKLYAVRLDVAKVDRSQGAKNAHWGNLDARETERDRKREGVIIGRRRPCDIRNGRLHVSLSRSSAMKSAIACTSCSSFMM